MKQVLYCLSHASNPFCSGYFGNSVLLFAQASLDHDPIFPGMTGVHTMPSYFLLRWGVLQAFSFWSGLAWIMTLPVSASCIS
jgi:hypothetical protein